MKVRIVPGKSAFEQIVYAATRAFVSGELAHGEAFPSVRALAADLKVHPNTAHKVIQHLIQEGWLEVRPGIGTTVATPPRTRAPDRHRLVKAEVDQLVVSARRMGASLGEIIEAVEESWKETQNLRAVNDGR
ncbi:MAG: GntR family transcriptional regulator [Pseudomonadota bacterium]